jgi:hypothetical protein
VPTEEWRNAEPVHLEPGETRLCRFTNAAGDERWWIVTAEGISLVVTTEKGAVNLE